MHRSSSQSNQQHPISKTRGHGLAHGFALVGYALLTIVMTWPLAANFASAIPGDGFDGWQNYWNLWWVKVALIERVQNPLVTDLLYYPTGVGLYFHTLNPFNGLVTLPIQVTAGLIAAYNSVVLISWTLGGYGVFLLSRWILGRTQCEEQNSDPIFDLRSFFPPFLAGAIFTFSPFHMAHLLGHMQVMSLQWIAFYVLYLLMAMTAVREGRPWLRTAIMAGLFLVLTGLCDWYFVLYLVFFTAIAYVWLAVPLLFRPWGEVRVKPIVRLAGPPLVAAVLFAIVLSPWLVPMVSQTIRFDFMERPQSDLYILSASVMDFLTPNRLHTLFRPESFTWIGNQVAPVSERTISIGYLALMLAGIGLFVRPKQTAFWLVMAVTFLLLALGPILHLGNITWDDIPSGNETQFHLTPMGVLNYFLPIASISRSISRFALMVQLSIAVMAGFGTAMLFRKVRTGSALYAVAGLLMVIVLAESWVAPYPLSPPDTPAYYEQMAADSGNDGAVLNLPMNYDRPGYLLYQTVHQRPLAIAYISRDDPRTLTERMPVLQHFRHLGPDIIDVDPAAVGQTVLADIGVETVVLDRYKMPGGLEREYTEQLAEAIFAGTEPVYEDDRITIYAVTPPMEPQPYLVLDEEYWGPLEMDEDGQGYRLLVQGPTLAFAHHIPDNARLRIEYRTEPDVTLAVSISDSDQATTLPAAPDGNEVLLDLEMGAEATIAFTPSEGGNVWIENVGLVGP